MVYHEMSNVTRRSADACNTIILLSNRAAPITDM